MTSIETKSRSSLAMRRAVYVVAVAVNTVMLCLINYSPGGQAMPFLTDGSEQVVGLVNAVFVAGIVVNVVYLVHDALWLGGSVIWWRPASAWLR